MTTKRILCKPDAPEGINIPKEIKEKISQLKWSDLANLEITSYESKGEDLAKAETSFFDFEVSKKSTYTSFDFMRYVTINEDANNNSDVESYIAGVGYRIAIKTDETKMEGGFKIPIIAANAQVNSVSSSAKALFYGLAGRQSEKAEENDIGKHLNEAMVNVGNAIATNFNVETYGNIMAGVGASNTLILELQTMAKPIGAQICAVNIKT